MWMRLRSVACYGCPVSSNIPYRYLDDADQSGFRSSPPRLNTSANSIKIHSQLAALFVLVTAIEHHYISGIFDSNQQRIDLSAKFHTFFGHIWNIAKINDYYRDMICHGLELSLTKGF